MIQRTGDLYSTFVTWSKVTLPILALALLSTLFLVSGKVDVTQSLPYANSNVDEIIKDQRISRPFIDSVTDDGTEVTLTAAFAKPDITNPGRFTTEDLQLRLRNPDSRAVRLTAKTGVVDRHGADLRDGVTIVTSDGFTIKANSLAADFAARTLAARDGISTTLAIGSLTADSMVVTDGSDQSEIVFQGNVHLVYQPTPAE